MSVLRADALALPLADESVDLIVTSPPYFALRSYQDEGEHYDGQIGSEPTPAVFVAALWAVTRECWRVLKPTGSLFVNLGDKYAGSGGHNNAGIAKEHTGSIKLAKQERNRSTRRSAPDRYNQEAGHARAKSLMGLPWRYAIGCVDGEADPTGIGWILRAEVVWSKPNGLPESATDRVRRSHETWFHLTKQGAYYAAIDELRVPYEGDRVWSRRLKHDGDGKHEQRAAMTDEPDTGRLPGSVWDIPTEPLVIPPTLGIDHFAAFPTEWPRRIVLGWSPSAICSACGEGRRLVAGARVCSCTPFVDHAATGKHHHGGTTRSGNVEARQDVGTLGGHPRVGPWREYVTDGWTPPPSRPAVVLDPFGGTGTTALVANAVGRVGVSVDLSADYCRLAQWRINNSDHDLKPIARTEGNHVAKSLADRRAAARAGQTDGLALMEMETA